MATKYKKKTDMVYATKDNPMSPAKQRKLDKAIKDVLDPNPMSTNVPQYIKLDGDRTSQILMNIKQLYMQPKCKTIEEMYQRMEWYFFDYCVGCNMKPTITGATLALGISKDTFNAWGTGKYGKDKSDLILHIRATVETMLEVATMTGELNPQVWMFYGKNYFGMADKQEMVLSPKTDEQPSVAEIQERLQSMPSALLEEDTSK